jgi:hypothetical protein
MGEVLLDCEEQEQEVAGELAVNAVLDFPAVFFGVLLHQLTAG